jgi:hypothetical protein
MLVKEEVSNNKDNAKSSYISTGTVSNYIDGNFEKGRHVTCVCRENLRAEWSPMGSPMHPWPFYCRPSPGKD